ncbi:MAG: hypothetical protein IT548_17270 [Alphaproteobacteria bacterium]|nr:hypothetical protein [Alphaproteobacteria bacterium]
MRTYILYGALALAGCATPEAAFPRLADLNQPPGPRTTPDERAALKAKVEADGEATREAGAIVRSGRVTQPLPRQTP